MRTTQRKPWRAAVGTCLAAIALAGIATAQLAIDWHSVDGGGGVSSGGTLEVSGTIGQHDAGAMAGGSLELVGGFWAVTLPALCAGDVDGDGTVNITDLGILLSNFGIAVGATRSDGDLSGDGAVNITDLGELLAAFGSPCN